MYVIFVNLHSFINIIEDKADPELLKRECESQNWSRLLTSPTSPSILLFASIELEVIHPEATRLLPEEWAGMNIFYNACRNGCCSRNNNDKFLLLFVVGDGVGSGEAK